MSDDNPDGAPVERRRVLKEAMAGGLLGAAALLPERWVKPVIDVVVVPAHAQTSPRSVTTTVSPTTTLLTTLPVTTTLLTTVPVTTTLLTTVPVTTTLLTTVPVTTTLLTTVPVTTTLQL